MQPVIGMILVVEGKTNRGRSRIGSHGDTWEITKLSNKVGFDGRQGVCCWALLKSLQDENHLRWMHLGADNDFRIRSVS